MAVEGETFGGHFEFSGRCSRNAADRVLELKVCLALSSCF